MSQLNREAVYDSFWVAKGENVEGPYTREQILAMDNPNALMVSPVGVTPITWDTFISFQTTEYTPSEPMFAAAKDKNMNKKAYDDGKWDLPGPADKFQPGDEVLYTNPSHLLDGLDMGFPPNKDKSPTLLPAEIVSVDSTMGGYYIKVENQDGPPIFVEQHSLVAPNEAGQSHTEEMPPLGKHLRDQLGIDETHRGEPQEVPLKALVQKKAAFYGGYTKDAPQVVDMFGTKFEVKAEYPRSRDGRPTAITEGEDFPREWDGRPKAFATNPVLDWLKEAKKVQDNPEAFVKSWLENDDALRMNSYEGEEAELWAKARHLGMMIRDSLLALKENPEDEQNEEALNFYMAKLKELFATV